MVMDNAPSRRLAPSAFLSLVSPILLYALVRLSGRLRWPLLVPLALALVVLVRMSVMAGLIGAGAGCLLALPVAGVCVCHSGISIAISGGVQAEGVTSSHLHQTQHFCSALMRQVTREYPM